MILEMWLVSKIQKYIYLFKKHLWFGMFHSKQPVYKSEMSLPTCTHEN
jgi:hypothetical protein